MSQIDSTANRGGLAGRVGGDHDRIRWPIVRALGGRLEGARSGGDPWLRRAATRSRTPRASGYLRAARRRAGGALEVAERMLAQTGEPGRLHGKGTSMELQEDVIVAVVLVAPGQDLHGPIGAAHRRANPRPRARPTIRLSPPRWTIFAAGRRGRGRLDFAERSSPEAREADQPPGKRTHEYRRGDPRVVPRPLEGRQADPRRGRAQPVVCAGRRTTPRWWWTSSSPVVTFPLASGSWKLPASEPRRSRPLRQAGWKDNAWDWCTALDGLEGDDVVTLDPTRWSLRIWTSQPEVPGDSF